MFQLDHELPAKGGDGAVDAARYPMPDIDGLPDALVAHGKRLYQGPRPVLTAIES